MGPPHEFALLGLTNTICWQVPFSSNASAFAETVESVQTCGHFSTHCDLDGAFSFAQAELQHSHGTLRLVLLYGRSQCGPRLVSPGRFSWLFQHPGFFLDALYLHPKQTADNNVQGVFDSITDLEKLLQPPMDVAAAAAATHGGAVAVRTQTSYMVEGTALSKVHKVRLCRHCACSFSAGLSPVRLAGRQRSHFIPLRVVVRRAAADVRVSARAPAAAATRAVRATDWE